jgi:hypothetical protein
MALQVPKNILAQVPAFLLPFHHAAVRMVGGVFVVIDL